MEKKGRSTSNYAHMKIGKYRVDHISELPDDILIMILSRLVMTEAARTSVLSCRWKKLWKFTTGSLDFDASESFHDLRVGKKSRVIERSKYISWVNQVLQSHQGTSIDDFRIRFDLDISSSSFIDSWIHFAIEKGVRRFELDLTGVWGFLKEERGYTFSVERLPCSTNSQPVDFAGCCSLTSVSLKYVNVSEEVVEHILANFPLLKRLCISGTKNIVNLKVVSPSHNLEHLEISACLKLKNLEISAINLLSFTYFGSKIDFSFKSFPKLSELSIERKFFEHVICSFREHSRYLSQLKTLKLKLNHQIFLNTASLPVKLPGMENLKQLELAIAAPRDLSVICFAMLIKAFPILHKLVIKLKLEPPLPFQKSLSSFLKSHREVAKQPHKCLKVVELAGFIECATHIKLALYLLNTAVSLDKLIIDLHKLDECGGPRDMTETEEKQAARKFARQLATKVPSGVELVVR